MIPRYSRPEMASIWSPETKFRIWFEIEAHAAEAMAEVGMIPAEAARTVREKGGAAVFDVDRIDEIERVTRHDVIAFLTHLAEIVGPEARFVHQGMTSSDVLDTTLAVQLARASDLLITDIDALLVDAEEVHHQPPHLQPDHGTEAHAGQHQGDQRHRGPGDVIHVLLGGHYGLLVECSKIGGHGLLLVLDLSPD